MFNVQGKAEWLSLDFSSFFGYNGNGFVDFKKQRNE